MNFSTSVGRCAIRRRKPAGDGSSCPHCGFSLVEVLVVVTLLSLIVLVLMTVFNSTQSAFRSGVTQTGVLEDGQAAMDLITSDLKVMTPSEASLEPLNNFYYTSLQGAAGFYVAPNFNIDYLPVYQSLPGSIIGATRTNLVDNFFILSRQNVNGHDTWVGTGYTVIATNTFPLFPLYRFTTNAPASSDPTSLFAAFLNGIIYNTYTNAGWSHLIDGVVDLRVHAFDPSGYQILYTNQYNAGQYVTYTNLFSLPLEWGEPSLYFMSNTVPASVEVQMGALEDHVLQRAESLPTQALQTNYLGQQAGRVHVFRQRVLIPAVDPTVYP